MSLPFPVWNKTKSVQIRGFIWYFECWPFRQWRQISQSVADGQLRERSRFPGLQRRGQTRGHQSSGTTFKYSQWGHEFFAGMYHETRSKQKYFSCKKGLIYVLRSIMKLQLGFNGKLLYLDMKYEDSYNGFPFNT